MTIVNINISDREIICVTDTLAYIKDEPGGFVPWKSWVFPKACMALASRGNISLSLEMVDMAYDLGGIYSEQIDNFIKKCRNRLIATKNEDYHKMGGSFSLYIMRFDCEIGKPIVTHIWRQCGKDPEVINIPSGYIVRPYISKKVFDRLPKDCNKEILKKIALAQWRVNVDLLDGGNCIGGLMHLTKINEEGASREVIGSFPDFLDTADKMGISDMPNAGEHEIALKELKHGKR